MAAATQKKKMSKKKKILIIVFSIIAFLLVATICAGLGVLHWYCQTKDYQVVSAADIVDRDTKIIAHRGFRAVAPETRSLRMKRRAKTAFGAQNVIFIAQRTAFGLSSTMSIHTV